MRQREALELVVMTLANAGVTDPLQLEPGDEGVWDGCVYVNYGFSEALTISPIFIRGQGMTYHCVAERWAPDHGLEQERWVGEVPIEYLPVLVLAFLDTVREVEG